MKYVLIVDTIRHMSEGSPKEKLPFTGKTVYFSGSIRGVAEVDPDFAWHLVRYMGTGGANVLSEHVAGRSEEERMAMYAQRTGQVVDALRAEQEPWWGFRQQDVEWVDQASHFVALINAPSFGVGMEIERAILKPTRGLPSTPILALIDHRLLDSLSFMVRGITTEEAAFHLRTYATLEDAQEHISDFLKKT